MTDPSAQTAYRNLTDRLRVFRKKAIAARCLAGLGLTLACGLGALTVLLLLEAALYLGPAAKLILEGAAGLGLLLLFCLSCLRPLLAPPSLEAVALQAEARFGGLQQRLISALQLWPGRESGLSGHSPQMVEAAVVQAGQTAAGLDLDRLVDRARPRRMALACLGLGLLLAAAFALWSGPLGAAAGRLAHPATAYTRPPETWVDLRPGNAEIVAGDPFEIAAHITGVVPTRVRLFIREAGVDAWTALELPVRAGRMAHRMAAVTRPFQYRLEAGAAGTPACSVAVRPRPMVTHIAHDERYPAYTRLGERRDVEGGDIVAPAGTAVTLRIRASLPLKAAWLSFDDSVRAPARVEGQAAYAELAVTDSRRYTVGLLDAHDIPNRDPVEYRIVALQDRPPEVRLLRPGADSELGESMQVPLLAEARDDFGVARMEVRFQINDAPPESALPVPLDSAGAKELVQAWLWDLSGLDLLPGDQVAYRLRVYDAGPGPGTGETPTFTIRFPSLLEIHQQAQQAQEESLERMEAMREAGRELRERLEKVARELLKDGDLDWQERKELETAVEDQALAAERLEEVVQKLNETLDRLEQSGLLADETVQKLQEVQELLSQIETPQLKEAMEKLREALQEVDPAAVQDALENFRAEQDAFQQDLDRTIALLKRVQQQQMMDALVKNLEALAAEQQDVVEGIQRGEDPAGLAEREDLLRRDAEQFRDELERASAKMEGAEAASEDLQRLSEAFEDRQVAGRMRQMGQELRSDQTDAARDRGRQIASDLADLLRQLRQARQAFVQRQKDRISQELNRALHDLLTLSQAQEGAARKAEDLSQDGDPAALALEQARIMAGANHMADRLMEASQKTFFITPRTAAALGRALQQMDEAADHLQSGRGSRAAASGREAMGALNAAALAVRQALADIDAAASALGFEEMLQRLQELSGQQSGLNAQSEDLFGQQRPGGLTPGQQMSLQQMAAQQQAIRQALEELQQQMGARRREILGDLGEIASEMEDVAREFQNRRLDRPTLKRQRQILSRLLDAQRSVRERGWSRQREARQGRDVVYRGPGSLPSDLGEADNPLRQRLREALNGGYPAEYQSLIRQYFESLIQDALAKQEAGQEAP